MQHTNSKRFSNIITNTVGRGKNSHIGNTHHITNVIQTTNKMAEQDKKAEMKQKIADIKAMITGELSKAMRRPRSSYGGPVRISSGVPMKFPYTFTAKLIQFPWKFYIRNQWIWKYYFIAVIVSIPVFKKISNLSNSKENKAKWAEMQRKEKHKH